MSTVDEIKARVDILDLVSETVQLRRSGKSYTGFCPFHPNTRTPAFVVFPESGTWRCFGQCNEGGDIFSFLMKREGFDFSEALRQLAERAGVELKAPTPQEQAAAEEHDTLRALLEEAVTFYRHQLLNTQPGTAALEYLHQRGLNDETIEAFGLGYAPASWEAALSHFSGKNYTEEQLLEAGLVTQREASGEPGARSGVYDRFRHRLMFPIRDERGRMSGFGARVLNPEDVPKFLNSPQTPFFDKGRLLYGLDRARKAIRTQDQAVIVEGYLDVIALHQAGFTTAVSPMGTALTEHQLYLLKRFSRRMVLALDPDAAGDKATLRGLDVARQAMDREADPVFDPRGLLRHEARLQADIRVTTLPEGMDPDDVVNRDPAEWQRILENARPVVVHVMETLARGMDLDDPKEKTHLASQVLPLIEDISSPLERDSYRQRLARLLRVDERALLGDNLTRPPARRRRSTSARDAQRALAPSQVDKTPTDAGYALEAHCLGVLLRRPSLVYRVDRALQEAGLIRLAPEDFQHAGHQAILRLILKSVDQDDAEPLDYALNRLSLPLMDLADGLLARTEKLDPNIERVLEDLLRALLDLRTRNLRQQINYLRYLMEEAQEQGDLQGSEYAEKMLEYTLAKKRLDHAIGLVTSHSVL
jgi:DNA primase